MTIRVIALADGCEGQDWAALGSETARTGGDPLTVLDTLVSTEGRVPNRDEERDFYAGFFGAMYRAVPAGCCEVCGSAAYGVLCMDCAELEVLIDEVIRAER